jgi:hypothetical protein
MSTDRDPPALAGADPLIALISSWASIDGQMRVVDVTLPEDEYNAALAVFYDPINKVEDQIGEAVPTSIAGAVALLRFLREWQKESENHEFSDRIVANLIAGLERLAEQPPTP